MENLSGLIILVLFFGVMYLLIIRPQQRRQREHQQLIASLSKGDDVITVGGLHGRVVDIGDDYVDLNVYDDVLLRFEKSAIAKVVREPEPSSSERP